MPLLNIPLLALIVANTDTENAVHNMNIPLVRELTATLKCEFSTAGRVLIADQSLEFHKHGYRIWHLSPGEGRVYRASHH